MVMAVDGDVDISMFLNGNDEYKYFYVGDSDGLKRQAQRAGVSREWRNAKL